jgi:hypothetical protein
MSNTTSYLWDFYFNLNHECTFEDIREPSDIKLKMKVHDDGRTKTVSGFEVQVNSATEQNAKDIAEKQAKKLVDILGVLSETPLGYTLAGFRMHSPNSSQSGTRIRKIGIGKYQKFGFGKPADLSKGNLRRLIERPTLMGNDQHLVDALGSANAGLKAYEHEMYEVMVRDFYLVIEKEVNNGKLNLGAKYKYLRDALSHSGRLRKIQKMDWWTQITFHKIILISHPTMNLTTASPKNRQHVRDKAIKLKDITINYLKGQVYPSRPQP